MPCFTENMNMLNCDVPKNYSEINVIYIRKLVLSAQLTRCEWAIYIEKGRLLTRDPLEHQRH